MSGHARAISRILSHALRHEPWLYELELDESGWAPVDAVLAALRRSQPAWAELLRADIEAAIATADKRRHELVGDRIRALYGHSLPGKLKRERAKPPAVLFHGTAPNTAEGILREGLKPMERQYVHLSVDPATAEQVGSRKAANPIVLQIAAAAAHDRGIPFYVGNEKVWLADAVPAAHISAANRGSYVSSR